MLKCNHELGENSTLKIIQRHLVFPEILDCFCIKCKKIIRIQAPQDLLSNENKQN